ncbi:hypothetical protein KIH27_08115 [Mycobacterium sp. M1]|uniref:Uncharacterized protein n=1 Tax=Mycolicibacter acidiphilus TaxID=2835306 RepID=A0ABS5RGX4_9MYCO|nr:hypothetical protein [Mycolicibacter acidiphilus]MBS9533550.1 hypothetical protein [Mycolicibacter acidiphilus]
MARLLNVIATAAVSFVVTVAGPAAADPGPTPASPPAPGFGSGWAQCGDRLVPADPRVDMQNPLGGLIYREMLRQMCGPGTTADSPTDPPEPTANVGRFRHW